LYKTCKPLVYSAGLYGLAFIRNEFLSNTKNIFLNSFLAEILHENLLKIQKLETPRFNIVGMTGIPTNSSWQILETDLCCCSDVK